MADVNNKLRLQIVTQLDAAGIKATKEQVDQLELGLRRAGNSASGSGEKFGVLEKTLGKLPGRIGDVAGKIGGLIGKLSMIGGAFSFGYEIGDKIVDVAKKFGLMKDPVEELIRDNKRYEYQLKLMTDASKAATEEEIKRLSSTSSAAESALKSIDRQTEAYFRQASALSGLKKAQGNAEMIQLQRAKFEDMRSYSDAGYAEAAEQLGRYYDVLEAELQAKQQIEEFDRESLKIENELSQAEKAYARASNSAAQAKERQLEAESNLQQYRNTHSINGWYTTDAEGLEDEKLEKIAERAKAEAEKLAAIRDKRAVRLENVDAEMLSRQMDRANLQASSALNIDRAISSYDSYVNGYGNPLNAEIDQSWANDLLQKSIDAEQNQRNILEVVKRFADNFERALNGGD